LAPLVIPLLFPEVLLELDELELEAQGERPTIPGCDVSDGEEDFPGSTTPPEVPVVIPVEGLE
jgi:hypothetical protein